MFHRFFLCYGSALVTTYNADAMRIQHFRSKRIRIRMQGFDYQNCGKFHSTKNLGLDKGVQATGKPPTLKGSVADPGPNPDPHVFGPPGSGSGPIRQRYGSEV